MKGPKSLAAIKRQIQENKIEKLQAKDATVGVWYVSKSGTMVVSPTAKGPDAVTLKFLSEYGDEGTCDVSPTYQLSIDTFKQEILMAKHTKAKGRVATLTKEKSKKVAVAADGTKKVAKSRGDKSEKTGYGTTTTAHLVGDIMLDVGVANKEACIAKIVAEFKKKTLYPDKELHWARAWFHNHVAKKPEIYKA